MKNPGQGDQPETPPITRYLGNFEQAHCSQPTHIARGPQRVLGAAVGKTGSAGPRNASDVGLDGGVPSLRGIPSSETWRNLRESGPDGRCHSSVSTVPIDSGISGHGVLFAVQSGARDLDGIVVTSFGFHINPTDVENGGAVYYEVRVLRKGGLYAHPDRDPVATGVISDSVPKNESYDYRWNRTSWETIANGTIVEANLANYVTILDSAERDEEDFFEIPLGTFAIDIPGNGTIRSFIIAARQQSDIGQGSFIYSKPGEEIEMYEELELSVGRGDPDAPKILAGEGIGGYPMPEIDMMYQMRSFVGKVYYEEACPSLSPSESKRPSAAPTIASSGSPSSSPTSSIEPSDAPSVLASGLPSLVPSHPPIRIEPLDDGRLWVSIDMVCTPGEKLPDEDGSTMSESVQKFTDESKDEFTYNVEVTTVDMSCARVSGRRVLLANLAGVGNDLAAFHRQLPTSSSAMDFSLVITGEYRANSRPGQNAPTKPPDLGIVAEDSINRDLEGFAKDLRDRARIGSPLQVVEAPDITVSAGDVNRNDPFRGIARDPIPAPTAPATVYREDNTDGILLICIVITGGIIVLLAAFLIFRHGQRRAARARREDRARLEERKMNARSGLRREEMREDTIGTGHTAGRIS